MFNDKFKAYKFSIIVCIIISLMTGINFIVFDVRAMGIAFVIASAGSILNLFAYMVEKEKK